MFNRIKPFASIRSDDEALKLMMGDYDAEMGNTLARQMLAAKSKTNIAEIGGDARTDAADKLASGAFFNSLIGGIGTLAGAGIKAYNANQASNVYANSDYDYPMYEDPAITGGQDVYSEWNTDMGVNDAPIYKTWNTDYSTNPKYDPSSDSYNSFGNRFDRFFNTGWF
tara:strand:- start:12248 stop:12751 length:504 start_codon:yes stop_codon:yes gene_type:complete